ncbi:hypothetical protein L484_023932 [Morus notabilis]|uniref:Uncharacterized protein n=1 Tax=Morus notabilis TaxID=981085 RepID=W9RB10_9ROSA|nr:hypothetical protein L484_023932 [Morus notabilis]
MSFMVANGTGLYLLAIGATDGDGSMPVIMVNFLMSDLRVVKLDSDGRLKIKCFIDDNFVQEFSVSNSVIVVLNLFSFLGSCCT